MKHTFSLHKRQKTNEKATKTNTPDCPIATDDDHDASYLCRNDGTSADIASSAIDKIVITEDDLDADPLAPASLTATAIN